MNHAAVRRDADRFVGALVGAALGDVLGWPHENRANRVGQRKSGMPLEFIEWKKRSGGRFHPYEETIEPGAYSDDTQLMIAVARSRLGGNEWWRRLASVELPFWTAYERGGGGASLRAARLLLKGILPWEAAQAERAKYFRAGGNGVAMRIAPHVLANADALDFRGPAVEIMADGVLTHGHPAALVGALVYGHALWSALRHRGTLPFGELVRSVESGFEHWLQPPDLSQHWPTWGGAVSAEHTYPEEWRSAVDSVRTGLATVRQGLSAGALAIEEETLQALGCFDPKVNGSGIVCALAAIFLASKHAASPFEGVTRAALAKGADTDTIASMTGAIAGAIAGTEWLGDLGSRFQDREFIGELGQRLAGPIPDNGDHFAPVTERQLAKWKAELKAQPTTIEMPIGGTAKVVPHHTLRGKAGTVAGRSWRLIGSTGQTFVLKDLSPKSPSPSKLPLEEFATRTHSLADAHSAFGGNSSGATHAEPALVGVALAVQDLSLSREFYEGLLEMRVSRATPERVQLGPMLILQRGNPPSNSEGMTLFIQVRNVSQCRNLIIDRLGIRPTPISQKGGRKAFACRDPDGYPLEIFEREDGVRSTN